jgi:hypothetical protein
MIDPCDRAHGRAEIPWRPKFNQPPRAADRKDKRARHVGIFVGRNILFQVFIILVQMIIDLI